MNDFGLQFQVDWLTGEKKTINSSLTDYYTQIRHKSNSFCFTKPGFDPIQTTKSPKSIKIEPTQSE